MEAGNQLFAKMIVNLFRPTSGDIYFNDVCITKIKSNKEMLKFRRQIQMIFQDPYSSLNGRLKVRDIISEPIKLHRSSITTSDLDDYINDLLESVELTKQSAKPISTRVFWRSKTTYFYSKSIGNSTKIACMR